jgi:hypothetical protein
VRTWHLDDMNLVNILHLREVLNSLSRLQPQLDVCCPLAWPPEAPSNT